MAHRDHLDASWNLFSKTYRMIDGNDGNDDYEDGGHIQDDDHETQNDWK